MTSFKVSVPDNKTSFFIEFLELIGASYQNTSSDFELSEEQKQMLLSQNEVPLDQCQDAETVYEILKKKYEL
jgi:hypothetical protein